jgi:hypothetical protein
MVPWFLDIHILFQQVLVEPMAQVCVGEEVVDGVQQKAAVHEWIQAVETRLGSLILLYTWAALSVILH